MTEWSPRSNTVPVRFHLHFDFSKRNQDNNLNIS